MHNMVIRELRERQRITTKVLARIARINEKILIAIEDGSKKGNYEQLSRIAHALGVDYPYLFMNENNTITKARKLLHTLSDAEIEEVISYIDYVKEQRTV